MNSALPPSASAEARPDQAPPAAVGPGTGRTCNVPGCSSAATHRGIYDQHVALRFGKYMCHPIDETPLVCVCHTPQPDDVDMCTRCLRVVAELVRRRRMHAVDVELSA